MDQHQAAASSQMLDMVSTPLTVAQWVATADTLRYRFLPLTRPAQPFRPWHQRRHPGLQM